MAAGTVAIQVSNLSACMRGRFRIRRIFCGELMAQDDDEIDRLAAHGPGAEQARQPGRSVSRRAYQEAQSSPAQLAIRETRW